MLLNRYSIESNTMVNNIKDMIDGGYDWLSYKKYLNFY